MSWWEELKRDLAIADGFLACIFVVGYRLFMLMGIIFGILYILSFIGHLLSSCGKPSIDSIDSQPWASVRCISSYPSTSDIT